MLRVLGNPKTLCTGVTRRDLLHIGGLSLFGLSLHDLLLLKKAKADEARRTSGHFGQAKACILIYKYGSPPQHETFDPKPEAPLEYRGEMKDISTKLPGIRVSEGLPRIAEIMDRLTVVRSLTHPYPLHGTAYAVTGIPSVDTGIEANPRHPRQWPFIGSIVDWMEDRQGHKLGDAPRNVVLPWVMGTRTEYPPLAGPFGTWLGQKYDPVVFDFNGKATRKAPPVRHGIEGFDNPYMGIEPDGSFTLGDADGRFSVSRDRFDDRKSLLKRLDELRRFVDVDQGVDAQDHFQQMAYSLLTSSKVHNALDLDGEPLDVRQRYGMTVFGQASLAARRLVECGCKFVTVFWDAYGLNAGGWDTHYNHFPRLKKLLLPGFDQTYSALILDLEQRGMLDETLVLCLSEHGRTPKVDTKPAGGGRHHWSRVYSQVFAGGGMAPGNVIGKSDRIGGDVVNGAMSPKDILATSFHLLGIDPKTMVEDFSGQPFPICGDGRVRDELLA